MSNIQISYRVSELIIDISTFSITEKPLVCFSNYKDAEKHIKDKVLSGRQYIIQKVFLKKD